MRESRNKGEKEKKNTPNKRLMHWRRLWERKIEVTISLLSLSLLLASLRLLICRCAVSPATTRVTSSGRENFPKLRINCNFFFFYFRAINAKRGHKHTVKVAGNRSATVFLFPWLICKNRVKLYVPARSLSRKQRIMMFVSIRW